MLRSGMYHGARVDHRTQRGITGTTVKHPVEEISSFGITGCFDWTRSVCGSVAMPDSDKQHRIPYSMPRGRSRCNLRSSRASETKVLPGSPLSNARNNNTVAFICTRTRYATNGYQYTHIATVTMIDVSECPWR